MQTPAIVDLAALTARTSEVQEETERVRKQIRRGEATTGDLFGDFVYCNFHEINPEKVELYRRLTERFARHAGEFLMVRSAKFVRTRFPLVPDGSEHKGMVVPMMYLGIIGEQPLIFRAQNGELGKDPIFKTPFLVSSR